MELYAGLPFWLVKNALFDYRNALKSPAYFDVCIIGSGITGALVAHELCSHGISCAVFDKRTLSTGSSAASTAQLQYEIDTPLSKLIKIRGQRDAAKAYHASLQSIEAISEVFRKTKVNADFEYKPTLFLASDKKGERLVEQELKARKEHGLPVSFLDKDSLVNEYHISAVNTALWNDCSAQMDAYKGSIGLLEHHRKKNGLQLFPYCEIINYKETATGYDLYTNEGTIVTCKYLVIAAGYEAGKFLPKKVMDLNSTYALVTEPVSPDLLWKQECMIWETASPYFYMRTTNDQRLIMGGGDVSFKNERLRDVLLPKKERELLSKFSHFFPDKDIKVEMVWCGTFSSTKDGLPYIGSYPGHPKMLFALGYGGNGITFSMIAAQLIYKQIKGIKDERFDLFRFNR